VASDKLRPDLEAQRKILKKALVEIHSFAYDNNVDSSFKQLFNSALQLLGPMQNSDSEGKCDIAPVDYLPKESLILFEACRKAWVFGGMGSWNDIGFEKEETQKEYDRVSENLYQAVTTTIQAIATSSLFTEVFSESASSKGTGDTNPQINQKPNFLLTFIFTILGIIVIRFLLHSVFHFFP
jgi:hypothetical protein